MMVYMLDIFLKENFRVFTERIFRIEESVYVIYIEFNDFISVVDDEDV